MSPFGERLKKVREKRGWDQQELAKHAAVPYMTIWRLEKGNHDYPRVDVLKRLAQTLGCTSDYLIGMYEDDEGEILPATAALLGGSVGA
jgi:transcriptional regulator with XRE-family HTH domain